VKAIRKIGFFLVVFLVLSVGDLQAQDLGDKEAQEETQPLLHRFSVSGKISYHTFWKQGLLENGDAYGRPGLGVSNLIGVGGELDLDYHWRPYMVFALTVGAYPGNTDKYKIDIVTGYVLLTAKLQRSGRIADYYLGAGLGGWFSQIDAEGTSSALKPGLHGLIGIKVHVTPRWDVLLEDRMAFTLHAEEGFGDLDLGGNFVLLGGSYNL
jgi:hypothetical protein